MPPSTVLMLCSLSLWTKINVSPLSYLCLDILSTAREKALRSHETEKSTSHALITCWFPWRKCSSGPTFQSRADLHSPSKVTHPREYLQCLLPSLPAQMWLFSPLLNYFIWDYALCTIWWVVFSHSASLLIWSFLAWVIVVPFLYSILYECIMINWHMPWFLKILIDLLLPGFIFRSNEGTKFWVIMFITWLCLHE